MKIAYYNLQNYTSLQIRGLIKVIHVSNPCLDAIKSVCLLWYFQLFLRILCAEGVNVRSKVMGLLGT